MSVAKIYLDEAKNLVFEALSDEIIEGKIYPSGGNRIGVVIIDTKNNLEVTEEAFPFLKNLFENAVTDGGDLGDIDWFRTDDGKFCFGWIGQNKRIFLSNEQVWKSGNSLFYPDQIKITD